MRRPLASAPPDSFFAGQRYGYLLIERIEHGPKGGKRLLCICDCGKTVNHSISRFRNISFKSCGCMIDSKDTVGNVIHGGYGTPEYRSWRGMISRCENPKMPSWPNYGAIGISVCERWRKSFSNFLLDMGKRPTKAHSLERINVRGNYEPTNCKWATIKEQNRNRTDNRFIEVFGKRMCVSAAAELYGVNHGRLYNRIYNGWPPEAAITFPVGSKRPKAHT